MAGLAVNTRGSSHEAKSGASGGLYGHRLLLVESIQSICITITEVINWQSTDFCCVASFYIVITYCITVWIYITVACYILFLASPDNVMNEIRQESVTASYLPFHHTC